MTKLLAFLKANAGHFIGAALLCVALLGFRSWLTEHDARLVADGAVKTAQAQVATLQAQQATVTQAAKVQIVQLQAAAVAVKTAPEAIAALPLVETPDAVKALDVQTIPDSPDRVSVNAVPLYDEANSCKQTEVDGAACATKLALQVQIDEDKDEEIAALKKKPGFWKTFGKTAKVIGCSAAGGAAGGYFKGAEGAGVGAAMGAGLCQMF